LEYVEKAVAFGCNDGSAVRRLPDFDDVTAFELEPFLTIQGQDRIIAIGFDLNGDNRAIGQYHRSAGQGMCRDWCDE
jgi:hypothetical protein